MQADWEHTKIINNTQNIMYGTQGNTYRLKSRNSFMKRTKCITRTLKEERVERQREKIGNETAWIILTEDLAPRHNNKWVIQRSLNRLQTKVGRYKINLKKWGSLESSSALCEYSEEQTMEKSIS